jgi:catechol 2,3-dioxygenase-like lactoylglutathione lyase family enzyme
MKKSRIRHIALAAEDPEKTAEFYKQVFGTDGVLNSADFRGIHHFGVQVEDVEGDTKKIEALGGECFLRKPEGATMAFFETKFVGPDGVVFDITDHPWVGNQPDR